MGSHTIILVQYTKAAQTRTFYDYKTVSLAAEGITSLFERHLKEQNPHLSKLSYDIKDLYSFVDQLMDISALVHDSRLNAYIPYAKSWVKEQLGNHIRKQFQGNTGRRK